MIKNYFTIAFRTLLKNKAFAAINILGLSIGISASLVIWLLVDYHFSFDQFQQDRHRIYRVVSNFSFAAETYRNSGVSDPMGPAVRNEITGLEKVASLRTWDDEAKISVPGLPDKEPVLFKKQAGMVFADSNYFSLVPYKWIAGSAKFSLNKPYQAVLVKSTANLYFPGVETAAIIGKQLYVNDTVSLTVSGIVNDLEARSDFTFKVFLAYTTLESTSLQPHNWKNWGNTNGSQQLWLKLANGTPAKQVEAQITALAKRNDKREPGDNSKTWHALQPLSDLHFNGDYRGYDLPTAHKPTLYGLLAVALFLLLLGCINFVNLTTAHAAQRAREIGIRKTMGSTRKQLVIQFLTETFLLTFLATIISIALTPLILKAFAGFIPKELQFSLQAQPGIVLFLLAIMVVVTLFSGLYPALFLSAYKPVVVLKNQAFANSGKTRNAWLRKSLTISQFVIAQVFIMAAILVSKQITFSVSRDLGFKKEAIVYVQTNYYDTVRNNKARLLDKLKAIPEIAMVSLSSSAPSSNNTWSSTMKYKDGKKEIETDVQQKFGDTNFIKLYQVKLLAGTNLGQSDTVNGYLLNQTYARILGFTDPQKAIGKKIEWSNKQVPIVGVVADFHQKSVHEPIKPLVIANWDNPSRTINMALYPQLPGEQNWKTALSKVEKAWKEVYPADDFEYNFFDADIAKFYEAEQHISSLLKWATGLAVFISCLGLLGLVIYTTTQRTKEIGVRKVLGASVAQIVSMISKDFIVLVLIAFLIAAPIAGYGMYKWLQNFAYRTDISWWIYGAGGLLMILVALVTLSFQTVKAAMANPVKSLRSE
ncbi:MAG: ABC transporter permease [Bacteroidota bacterium]